MSRRLALGLIIAVGLVSVLPFLAFYRSEIHEQESELLKNADESRDYLVGALELPLWKDDDPTMESICRTLFLDDRVVGLVVRDAAGANIHTFGQVRDVDGFSRVGKIFHRGRLLGEVGIHFTRRYVQEAGRRLWLSYATTMLFVLITMALLTHLLVRKFLQIPLARLNAIARPYAEGNYDTSLPALPYAEFQPFGRVLSRLGEKISAQMKEQRAAEEKYRSIFKNAVEGIFQSLPEGGFLDANPALAKIFGYDSPDELIAGIVDIGQQLYVDPGDRASILQILQDQGLVQGYEVQMYRRDGARIWVSVNAHAVRDQTGGMLYLEGSLEDITEHKEREAVLRSTITEVQDLYNEAPCGYHSLDREGKYVRINDTELRWLGYEREAVVGKLFFADLLAEPGRQLFQESFPNGMERGGVNNQEFELRRRDGTLLPVLLSATTIYDDGEFVMSRATIFDITEQRKAAAQERLLSAIVQSSDDAIIAKDLDGTILSWNRGAERIYGYCAEEVVGRSIELLVPPDCRDELATLLAQLRQGERIEHFITERQRKDGGRISVALTLSPIRDAAGGILGVSTIARSVTEQRQVEAELALLNIELEGRVKARTLDLRDSQRALMNLVEDLNEKTAELEEANTKLQELDRLKSMFIASMSHELRTPLNSIIGYSSILRDEWIGPVNPEQKENLAIILRCGKVLLNLINDVIDVSKIETGKIESVCEAFDLRDLIEEAVSLVGKGLEEKGIELRVTAPRQPMHTDRRRLLQCVLNLLSNAVKFTERGCVTLESRIIPGSDKGGAADLVEIAVTDTGVGIQEKDLPRMFQPFVRFSPPLQQAVPGTGLGLYLTRKLSAEVLKGTVLVNSEFGKGSRFTLRLPVRLP